MIINKHSLRAVLPASSTDETRYNLNGILIEPAKLPTHGGTIVATDGHRLHRVVQGDNGGALEEWPAIHGGENWKAQLGDAFILPRDAAKALERSIPSQKRIPANVRGKALVDCEYTNRNGVARFITSDRDRCQTSDADKIDGSFPEYRQILPSETRTEEPTLEVGVNARYLMEACKAALELAPARSGAIKLRIWGKYDAFEVETTDPDTGDRFTAVVMPMRLE